MNHSWHLGKIAGIDLRLHWTFLLLPAWIYFANLAAGSGAVAATVAVLFVFAVFGCVVLHELGHSLTARRFGIHTKDITLLPIGGVAALERIPRTPWQELAIAVAGPAVNVVIATMLFLGLPLITWSGIVPTTGLTFLMNLAWVNVALVLFNMLPAFPMDGGRVLRAALALTMPYRKATGIAANVGQFVAIGFGLVGLMTGNVLLVFVAGFVYLAARSEVMMADEPVWNAKNGSPSGVLIDANGKEIGPVRPAPLPVVSARWNAQNVLGWLSSDAVDEFVVSDRGVPVAVVRKQDLREVVDSGLGSHPIERLLAGHALPFQDIDSYTAA
tara:strand:- start:111854 stop:112840 length:987 start_codon:yes stop_codon:yes gene_type:complete